MSKQSKIVSKANFNDKNMESDNKQMIRFGIETNVYIFFD